MTATAMGKLECTISECFLNWLDLHQFSQVMSHLYSSTAKLLTSTATHGGRVQSEQGNAYNDHEEENVQMRQDESGQPAKQLMELKED